LSHILCFVGVAQQEIGQAKGWLLVQVDQPPPSGLITLASALDQLRLAHVRLSGEIGSL
jgi:hypothetical protein